MQRQPLLILTVCFILGIVFQDKIVLADIYIYLVILIGLGASLLLFFHSYFLHTVRSFLSGLLFFCAGTVFHFYNTPETDPVPVNKEKGSIVFRITRKLNSNEKYRKYEGAVQLKDKNFNAVIYLPKSTKELDFAHYYKADAFITQPYSPQYDFQFDYAGYLKRKNIEQQVYLQEEISSAERADLSVSDRLHQYRFKVLKKIDRTVMSVKTKEFLKGIILADRTEMDAATVQDFNRSGLVHFLAISGTHIVVIFGIFYFLMRYLGPLKFRKYTVIFSLVFIWLFAAFIGFGNSVLRSCMMLSIYFISVLLQRKPDLLHSLSLSALIILVSDTQQFYDVGFQLSFVAVLGIFWLNQPFLKYFPRQDHYIKKLIFNTITISLSAQLATLPLVLYYFHQFSFISMIANFIIVPFSEVIIVFSFLMTALVSGGFDFELINNLYDFIIQILLKTIHWFAEADVLFFENIPMNLIEILSVSVVIFLLRPAILKFDFRNSMRLAMAFLVFLMVRTGSNVFENRKEEMLSYTLGRNKAFSVKSGSKVCFWISDKTDYHKALQFIVKPYCSSRRIDEYEVRTLPLSARKVVFRDRIYDLK
ncbi:ComEC/Rec2 family competence protein [Chryseobacterium sp.]|uniref:ComEC/Rec2 family competence protein n=1 Tax=Chryseobacterium sp. TaxID=1871047 RepID=UPI0028A054AE|nr:ComEC/Rec2 family competence protein [Chryseobacterium sp.]